VNDTERMTTRVEMLRAVAHPVRLAIVQRLCAGEAHVNVLAERVGVSQPIVSQQLRILRMRGLVAARREGGFARYRLQEPALRALVRCMRHAGLARRGRPGAPGKG
jgi:ArsR family transcriptional regulator